MTLNRPPSFISIFTVLSFAYFMSPSVFAATDTSAVLTCYSSAWTANGGNTAAASTLCANVTSATQSTQVLSCYSQAWTASGGNTAASSILCASATKSATVTATISC